MQITKENKSALSAIVTLKVEPTDYQDRVAKTLKKYAKSANIPGFRPGMAPMGHIKKLYGKSVLAEELNTLLQEKLQSYINEEKIDVLGVPLPLSTDVQSFEDGSNFEFLYELGLAPTIAPDLKAISKTPYYMVNIDDKMVQQDVDDLRRRYGKFSNPEVIENDSIIYGTFTEVDQQGIKIEGGHSTTTTLAIEFVKSDSDRALFIGKNKDATIIFNPMKAINNETEVAAMLKSEKGQVNLQSDYELVIKTINKVEKATLDQEFFDKIYGPGVVSTEAEFYGKVKEGITNYFERESDRRLKKDLKAKMISELSIPLPDDFLKRMLKAQMKKEVDDATFEHDYLHESEDLKWRLIIDKLAADHSFNVANEEVDEAARGMLLSQFSQYGGFNLEEDKLNEYTRKYLQEGRNYERIAHSILENKVFEVIKKEISLDIITQQYEEYISTMNAGEKHAH